MKTMKKIPLIPLAVVFGSLIAGCASTGGNLQRETARYIGGNTSPDQVQISDVDRGATSVTWKANTPNGLYDCSADDMMRRVYCTKKGK